MLRITQATVLGAGTMGAQIAAHLANAGVSVLLLDRTPEEAAAGLKRARALKPDPFFTSQTISKIRTGGFDALAASSTSDWIIEAIVENLEAKRDLMARVDDCRSPAAVVSSNTSGISLAAIAEGRSEGFRRNWLGTHFFNPPRYLHLLEIIPTPDTDPHVVAALSRFADLRLGKGVVVAKDTPSFIANRIGLFGVVRLLEALASRAYSVEEIDAITGPAIGRPKSATCRTMDLAGLDVLSLVTRDLARRLPADEGKQFNLPPIIDALIARGWLGEKSGQGFYKRVRDRGEAQIFALDLQAFAAGAADPYRPAAPVALPSLDAARKIAAPADRLRALFSAEDKAGALLRHAVLPAFEYAARVAPAIAHAPEDVDRAMRWGFGWAAGPIESLDVVRRSRVPGPEVRSEGPRVVRSNAAASLLDVGDGVFRLEFHSKMNTVSDETIDLMFEAVTETAKAGVALVVGNDGEHFSAGADLKKLVAAATARQWDAIERMIQRFQGANMALKTSPVPVVSAPAGLTLGGGCEVCLHTYRVQAAAEAYIGLVELGVGLIPAAGGSKEMLLRTEGDAKALDKNFETIALAKVSTSGDDARQLGYLRDVDRITMNRDRLLDDAKNTALHVVRAGYQVAVARADVPAGGPDAFARLSLGVHLAHRAGRISDFDALVARKLAWVLTGGNLAHRGTLSEQQLLDLEREAFLSLCGEEKTQARITHTLKTGKPLRN